jgi:hypothetical protein
MSVYKLFPSKDSTIYSKVQYKNTGLDEILELTVDTTSSQYPYNSRFLIQFDSTEIKDIYSMENPNAKPYTETLPISVKL